MYDYKVSESQEVSKKISERDVYLFAGVSGDFNSVHMNKVEAERSLFGRLVAPGILVGGLMSNVIGMKLPEFGTIYMEQVPKTRGLENMYLSVILLPRQMTTLWAGKVMR